MWWRMMTSDDVYEWRHRLRSVLLTVENSAGDEARLRAYREALAVGSEIVRAARDAIIATDGIDVENQSYGGTE